MSAAPLRLEAPAHLLVRLPNPVGDSVMATPALRALRRALPRTRITWLGRPGAQAVLAGLGDRDDVVPLAGAMAAGKRAPLRAGRFLAQLGADAALLLPNSWSSALAIQRAKIPVRVGSNVTRRGTLLTHALDLPLRAGGKLAARSMVDLYLDLAAPFGAVDDGAGCGLATTPFDVERATDRLAPVPPGLPVLALNPGAAFGPSKIYAPDRIAEAVRIVRRSRPVLPLILCGPGEEDLARAVCEALEGDYLSTHEAPPDLGELKALLQRAAVLATTDTGPRHMAEAFGVPTVVWMGPTDPRWSGHSQATVLREEGLPCLACHLARCAIGHMCMLDLQPARVARAILESLGA